MDNRLQRVSNELTGRFGSGVVRLFRGPGRVNLLGEHTDYNQGWVLPIAIDRDVSIAARPRPDRMVRLYSLDFEQQTAFSLDDIRPADDAPWSNYVRGMAVVLQKHGKALCGMDGVLQGNVPIASGLSSSAAMEVGFGLAFQNLAGFEMSPVDLALAAQQAEHEFIGVKCGIMDQYISRMGKRGHALLIDCRSLECRPIPIGDSAGSCQDGRVFVVGDTRVRRELASSEYNVRRQQGEEAVRRLQPVLPGITALRDVSSMQLKQHGYLLPDTILRRARHVVSEDERTLEGVEALGAGDLARFGRLMNASHESLRDDYQVSCSELDTMVKAARSVSGVLGSRMTGAGFGGCTVSLVDRSAVEALITEVQDRYETAFGRSPSLYLCNAEDGAHEVVCNTGAHV